MGVQALFVGILLTSLLGVTVYTFFAAPLLLPKPDEARGERLLASLATRLLLTRQATVLTDRRVVQAQKQLPLAWVVCWPLFWKSWQAHGTFIDLRELDSVTYRRSLVTSYLVACLVCASILVDLGLLALLAVLVVRVVQVELRSRSARIVVSAFARRAAPLVELLEAVQSQAATVKSAGVRCSGALDHADADRGQLDLGRLEIGAIAVAILAPAVERIATGTVSVDSWPWLVPLLGVPVFVGARRGPVAGAVAGLLAAGGLVGAIDPVALGSPMQTPLGEWLFAAVGLVVAGVAAGAGSLARSGAGMRVPALAALGSVGYLVVLGLRHDLLHCEAGWALAAIGGGAGTLAAGLAGGLAPVAETRTAPAGLPAGEAPASGGESGGAGRAPDGDERRTAGVGE